MNPLMGEAEVELEGKTLRLVMNNGAWAAAERVLDESYIDIIADMVRREIAGKSPKNSVVGALLWASLRSQHPEYTLSQCGDMMMEHAALFNEPLGTCVRRSIKLKEPEPGEAAPPETAESESLGTGT